MTTTAEKIAWLESAGFGASQKSWQEGRHDIVLVNLCQHTFGTVLREKKQVGPGQTVETEFDSLLGRMYDWAAEVFDGMPANRDAVEAAFRAGESPEGLDMRFGTRLSTVEYLGSSGPDHSAEQCPYQHEPLGTPFSK